MEVSENLLATSGQHVYIFFFKDLFGDVLQMVPSSDSDGAFISCSVTEGLLMVVR